jgi:hypothetical protein
LSGLGINLATTNVIVTQQLYDAPGNATKLGIASLDPPTIGSSPAYFYVNSSTVGPPGFYTVSGGLNANPGYRINVMTGPVPTKNSSWGRIKSLYR